MENNGFGLAIRQNWRSLDRITPTITDFSKKFL